MQQRQKSLIVFIGFALLATGRVLASTDRLPADPGYEFFEDSYRNGIGVLFKTEGGYLDIPRRILAEVVTKFPVRDAGYVGTALWIIMCAATALFVATLIHHVTGKKFAAASAGLIVILVPAASESQVGNQSVIKWFLVLVALLAVCLPTETRLNSTVTSSLIFISGLSNPITFAIASPIVLNILKDRKVIRDKDTQLMVIAFAVGFLVQISAWKTTGAGLRKYESPTYGFWPGAGSFWYYNTIIPPVTMAVFIVRSFLPPNGAIPRASKFVVDLAIAGFSLFVVSYAMSGIADRYLVVPQIVSVICVVIYVAQTFGCVKTLFRMALSMYFLIVIGACAKWYQSGWFLTGGPRWSLEVDLARERCALDSRANESIDLALGSTEFACGDLLSRP